MSNSTYTGRLGNIARPRRGPPPPISNPWPPDYAFLPSTSPLELLFPYNPILSAIISFLTTPALLSLYYTCHTFRYYLYGQHRYFRNLFLVPDSEAEKWQEPSGAKSAVKRSAVADRTALWANKLRDLIAKEDRRVHPAERVKIVKGYMWHLFKGHPVLPRTFQTSEKDWVVWLTMLKNRDTRTCFAHLMSRHLHVILTTMPVGYRLTTLVLDGTGVETDYIQHVLPKLEGTLRGLSVKGCPNIECYIWGQWLLEALQENRPVALEWLYIWGSGNTPTTDFDTTVPPLPLEPTEPHPDDPVTDFGDWNPSPSLFANALSVDFHLQHTVQILPAMTLSSDDRDSYMFSLRTVIASQYQRYLDTRVHEASTHWHAPPFPLGEPHPVIELMAVAKHLSITLDIAFCASRQDCYSFIHGRPIWENINAPAPPLETDVTVVHEATGVSWPMRMLAPSDDPIPLHTHCVAEIQARREARGTVCQNCGLWEDELSPVGFRPDGIDGIVEEYAGIKWGTGVGLGRTAIGYCCTDCVREMTCYGCNGFYCPSCSFVSEQSVATMLPNPLAAEPAGSRFLHWTCALHRHGPHCNTCMEEDEHFFVCTECDSHMCYLCHGLGGTTVSCALYTENGWDADNENMRFGVVGNVEDWEEGGYSGWGGESIKIPHRGKMAVGDSPGSWQPMNETALSNSTKLNYPSSDNGANFDPEHWGRSISQFTSDRAIAATNPEPHTFIDEDGPDSDLDAASSCGDHAWAARLKRMSETRIWELCARCATGSCASCLGYEEDVIKPGRSLEPRPEPEFRWCSGGCGRRFCDRCLNSCNGERAVDLVCGGVAGGRRKDPLMPGGCGACLCLECQEMLIAAAPPIGKVFDGFDAGWDGAGRTEMQRRYDERMGYWVCPRCELGLRVL